MGVVSNRVSCLRSSSRQYSSGRSVSQHRERDMTGPDSPVGGHTVWLSKKMKELTEKTPASVTATSASPRSRMLERNISTSSYSSTINDQERTERTTRSYLDELGSKMKTGGEFSPTDSFIDRMIISAGRDLSSPPPLSRNSSIMSLNIKQKQSPFNDYHSLPHRSIENELRSLESKYLDSRKDSPLKDYKTGRESFDPISKVVYLESSPLKSYIQSGKTQTSVTSRDRANSFHDIREETQSRSEISKPRTRHSTLPYGVAPSDVRAANFDHDMKSILKELESTGFFSQVGPF